LPMKFKVFITTCIVIEDSQVMMHLDLKIMDEVSHLL